MSNPLKLAALRWAHASVHGARIQIPWDTNEAEYGKNHFAYSKGTRQQIIGYTEQNCPHQEPEAIERWMKGQNPSEMRVGIDCSGFVYRVLDEACQISGVPGLQSTLGTNCAYTALDTLTPLDLVIETAGEIRAGDTMRFNKGKHSGVVTETVVDEEGRLREVWYAHSSFTRGPHIGWFEVNDPSAPAKSDVQVWHDEMWDGLSHNNLRDIYFTSLHRSPFYKGPRPVAVKSKRVQVAVDGRVLWFRNPPYLFNSHTFAHLRPLAEALGGSVAWDPTAQMATMTRGTRTAQCQVGSEVGVVGGEGRFLAEPPVMIGTNLMVPVRFLAEALGCTVEWNETARIVNVRRS